MLIIEFHFFVRRNSIYKVVKSHFTDFLTFEQIANKDV